MLCFMVIVMPSVTKVFPTTNSTLKSETGQGCSLGLSKYIAVQVRELLRERNR